MSSSLVRKALELVESEPTSSTHSSKKARHNEPRSDLKVQRRRCQGHKARVLGDVKSTAAREIELARRISSNKTDHTHENLKSLISRSKSKAVDFSRAQKILDRTVKGKKPEDISQQDSGSTVFSDEDFRKFEEDYFVS